MLRNKSLLVIVIALAVAISLSITGQEEPLPPVQPKTAVEIATLTPSFDLAVEPIHNNTPAPTLAEAARANDFATFDALYTKARGTESAAAFATLHELWSWSMNDPVGAFYGEEMYARLTRAYPGLARYLEDYRIVDDRGNVFYPTSETRAYLLDRALEGRAAAPRVLIAENRIIARPEPEQRATTSTRRTTTARATHAPKRAATQKPAPVKAEEPVIVRAEPAVVVPEPVATPVAPTSVATIPVAQPKPQTTSNQQPATTPAAQNDFANRGILLLVIGLIGVGLLAVILRTPKDAAPAETKAPVEQFRKTPAPESSPKSEEPAKPRATGSHG